LVYSERRLHPFKTEKRISDSEMMELKTMEFSMDNESEEVVLGMRAFEGISVQK
jgi:hypothetical protein